MCGIVGFWRFDGLGTEAENRAILYAMTSAVAHRGPDGDGYFFDPRHGIGLGHRRLAIIDLSPLGAQPMSNGAGSTLITFNGEIYNYEEIRRDLAGRGHRFLSHTDTEVVVHAYQEWGMEAALQRFRGMFAFALWDGERGELLLVRDRLGVKPLYYAMSADVLLFGSELKALLSFPGFARHLDRDSLLGYLEFGYVPSPRSILSGVRQVKPGHIVRITGSDSISETCYWSLRSFFDGASAPVEAREDVESQTLRLLREAFAYRLVADVPVGLFLSGGVDSSLVAAVLYRELDRPVQTFAVAFDEPEKDESTWARAVAQHLGADYTELRCTTTEALSLVPHLADIYDEPFSDTSAFPTYLMSRAAREHVKVALSGDGGDEFFCGYTTYQKFPPLWRRIAAFPAAVRRAASALLPALQVPPLGRLARGVSRRLTPTLDPSDTDDKLVKFPAVVGAPHLGAAYGTAISIWPVSQLPRLVPGSTPQLPFSAYAGLDGDGASLMMLIDAQTLLPDDLLVKVDRASMAVGLEVREPLLDHRLVEYALRLPLSYKYAGGTGKYVLRRILSRYLPGELVDRPKHGFSVPLGTWLRGPLRPLVMDSLAPVRLAKQGIFAPAYVARAVDGFYRGAAISPRKVWNLVAFQIWYERWMGSL